MKKFVIKPINEGSSVDVSIFDKLDKISKKIFSLIRKYKVLLQEEYIEGKEVQAAVLVKNLLVLLKSNLKENFMIIRLNITQKLKLKHIMPANLKKYL